MNQTTTITIEDHSTGFRIIYFHGDLDSLGTQVVQDSFSTAIVDRGSRVIVDLSDTNFISSAGMAMLLVKGKMLRQSGGDFYLVASNDRVHEVLALAGFHELFSIYHSLEEALAALENG